MNNIVLSKEIVSFFMFLYNIDLTSYVDQITLIYDSDERANITGVSLSNKNLGVYCYEFNTIVIKDNLHFIQEEMVLVHELNHWFQCVLNKSFTIDLKHYISRYDLSRISTKDLSKYTLLDLASDEEEYMEKYYGFYNYFDDSLEIDCRLVESYFQYYITNDIESASLLADYIFSGGITLKKIEQICNLPFGPFKTFFLDYISKHLEKGACAFYSCLEEIEANILIESELLKNLLCT